MKARDSFFDRSCDDLTNFLYVIKAFVYKNKIQYVAEN